MNRSTIIAILLCLGVSYLTFGQKNSVDYKKEEAGIRAVLQKQEVAWNEANIEAFMTGYWKSDSITFIGSEITQGWEATLARYKKTYPDQAAMGKLRFEILRVNFISKDTCMITGKYFLTRANDAPNGIFTLLFRKKQGQWVIVYDHTS